MMRSLKRYCVMLLGLLLLALPLREARAAFSNFYVTDPRSETAESCVHDQGPVDRVRFYKKRSGDMYLLLPGGWDTTQLRVWYSGVDSITVAGETVLSGQVTDQIVPGTVEIVAAKKKYKVQVLQGSQPAMFIQTASGDVKQLHKNKNHREAADMLLLRADGSTEFCGPIKEIKGRGNSTFGFAKKPYQIKLDEGLKLLGMGKHKTWVLLADYMDVTLLRNKITFDLAKAAGMKYTSDSRSLDLYVNGEYYGVYLLTEKVQIASSRVDITDQEKLMEEMNSQPLESYERFKKTVTLNGSKVEIKGYQVPEAPKDITGGYLLELEKSGRYAKETTGFVTDKGQSVVIKEPEFANEEQVKYIAERFTAFHHAISNADGVDPATGLHYTEIVDLDSLVKKYLIEEIAKNYDGNKTSHFFYKDVDAEDPLLYAGPVWDYDLGYGNLSLPNATGLPRPTGLYVAKDKTTSYYIYPRLYKQADFQQRLKEIYAETFLPALNVLVGDVLTVEGSGVKSIRAYAAEIEASARMNEVRWPSGGMSGNYGPACKGWDGALDYLENYISKRTAFLTEEWLGTK